MSVNSLVYVDDGLISLKVKEIGADYLKTEVVNGGKIGSRKGVNLPNIEVDLPAVSEKDIKLVLSHGIDCIMSFFFTHTYLK